MTLNSGAWHRIPRPYRDAMELLGVIALFLAICLAMAIISASSWPHEPHVPEIEFRVPPSEVIYPKWGAVGIWWNGQWTVINQVTWLEMTGANHGLSEYSSD